MYILHFATCLKWNYKRPRQDTPNQIAQFNEIYLKRKTHSALKHTQFAHIVSTTERKRVREGKREKKIRNIQNKKR